MMAFLMGQDISLGEFSSSSHTWPSLKYLPSSKYCGCFHFSKENRGVFVAFSKVVMAWSDPWGLWRMNLIALPDARWCIKNQTRLKPKPQTAWIGQNIGQSSRNHEQVRTTVTLPNLFHGIIHLRCPFQNATLKLKCDDLLEVLICFHIKSRDWTLRQFCSLASIKKIGQALLLGRVWCKTITRQQVQRYQPNFIYFRIIRCVQGILFAHTTSGFSCACFVHCRIPFFLAGNITNERQTEGKRWTPLVKCLILASIPLLQSVHKPWVQRRLSLTFAVPKVDRKTRSKLNNWNSLKPNQTIFFYGPI